MLFSRDVSFKSVDEGKAQFKALTQDIMAVQFATDRRGIARKRANVTAQVQLIIANARLEEKLETDEVKKTEWTNFIELVHDTYTEMLNTKETLKFGIDRVY